MNCARMGWSIGSWGKFVSFEQENLLRLSKYAKKKLKPINFPVMGVMDYVDTLQRIINTVWLHLLAVKVLYVEMLHL